MEDDQAFKADSGKPLAGCIKEFNLALMEVIKVSTFGAQKYERGSWKKVPDGRQRYEDALFRHLLQDGIDEESGLPHSSHALWNLMAIIQLDQEGD